MRALRLDRCFESDGGLIRWASDGQGAPVVLVHGTPYSSLIWRQIAPVLAVDHEVFAFDHLGYGQSDTHPDQDLGLAAQGRRFPVRLLWGRHDRILPTEFADWVSRRLPQAPLTREPNAGHLLAEDAPARLLAEIDKLIDAR